MISFCIPFRSQEAHRIKAYEFVHEFIRKNFFGEECVTADPGEPFNRSRARNMAASDASGDVLVFVDADAVVDPHQVLTAVRWVTKHETWAFPYDMYYSLKESATRVVMRGGYFLDSDCEYIFPSGPHPEPSVGGCIVVSRKAFETVGGYDERFIGWGEEDRAFALSLETLVSMEKRIPGPIYHLWHPWAEEDCFGQPHFMDNRLLCNRYRQAFGNPATMQQLVDERR